MPITRQQALTANEFHENHEPAGKIITWRRNGATQTWATRPEHFRVPVKYGLRSYAQIYHTDADRFHVAGECPTRHVRVAGQNSDGDWFYGIVVSGQYDGQLTVTVQVTQRCGSKHRVGSHVEVSTVDITDL